jgi:serine/threonine-protein kinase
MVTGRVPFMAEDPSDVMRKHLREKLIPPDHINTTLSAGISEVIEIMMAKRKRERYTNIQELLTDLEAIRDGRPPIRARERFDVSVFKQLGDGEVVVLEEDVLKQEISQRYRMALLLVGTIAAISAVTAIILLVHMMGR